MISEHDRQRLAIDPDTGEPLTPTCSIATAAKLALEAVLICQVFSNHERLKQ